MFVDHAMGPRLTAKVISREETQELLDHAAITTYLAKLPPLTLAVLTGDASMGCAHDGKLAYAFAPLATPEFPVRFTAFTGRVFPVVRQVVEVLACALAPTAVENIVDASWAISHLEDLAWVADGEATRLARFRAR